MNLIIRDVKLGTYNRKAPEDHGLRRNDRRASGQDKNNPVDSCARSHGDALVKSIGNPFGMILQRSSLSKIRDHKTRVNDDRKCPLNRLTIVMAQVSEQ